jgi:ABC-2 type transport system permease protein
VLGLVFVVGQMAWLLPGTVGEWIAKVMPGNAGSRVAMAVSFNPKLLSPWTGFAVFAGEVAVLLAVALTVFRRRDA